MLFVRLQDGIPVEYPLTYIDLERRFGKSTSDIDAAFLESVSMCPVTPMNIPMVDYTKRIEAGLPIYVDGNWVENYEIIDKTEEELEIDTRNAIITLRNGRNILLEKSDWSQISDSPLSKEKVEEWKLYRQSLRDLPAQPGFPWDVVWPTPPE
jgi:hypothetical protein